MVLRAIRGDVSVGTELAGVKERADHWNTRGRLTEGFYDTALNEASDA